MNNEIQFLQSCADFPLMVKLGEKVPSWGLSRWGGNKGLRFVPPDDEGFTLRGDKRRLLYKGRRRSHRFTILGDTAFEYDCILNREPESNVISLRMEGAENFDFLRQPDFVKKPLLAGSYAVYKKETLVGEGTGKLCHIHRPEIIDARGRRCWGDLSVVGNILHITIPEKWLSEAKYPVIVDPTIGTTTIGIFHMWDADPPEPWVPLVFEEAIAVNRFLLPESLNGSSLSTAFFYVNADDSDAGGRAVVYIDSNSKPLTRLTTSADFIDFRVTANKPKGWRSGKFYMVGEASSNSYVWFGCSPEYFWYPRYDVGVTCYASYSPTNSPAKYPQPYYSYNFKLSMYFEYTNGQKYTRTLTQGVTLNDNRRLTGNYKRGLTQTVGINSFLGRFETFYRKCEITAHNAMNMGWLSLFARKVTETGNVTTANFENMALSRKCVDSVNANSVLTRIQNVVRKVEDYLSGIDRQSFSVMFIRSVTDCTFISQSNSHWAAFIRGLAITAGSTAETRQKAEYHRLNADTVQAGGSVFRGLLLFVRIITKVFVRDYILGRFLKAKAEVTLKSCVVREIILESKIN